MCFVLVDVVSAVEPEAAGAAGAAAAVITGPELLQILCATWSFAPMKPSETEVNQGVAHGASVGYIPLPGE